MKQYAKVIATQEIVEVYFRHANGIAYVSEHGIKILFDGQYKDIDNKMTKCGVYCVKAFCHGSKGENLCAAYKTKKSAKKCFDERVKSMCYDKVILCLQCSVFFPETDLVLEEYHVERGN